MTKPIKKLIFVIQRLFPNVNRRISNITNTKFIIIVLLLNVKFTKLKEFLNKLLADN